MPCYKERLVVLCHLMPQAKAMEVLISSIGKGQSLAVERAVEWLRAQARSKNLSGQLMVMAMGHMGYTIIPMLVIFCEPLVCNSIHYMSTSSYGSHITCTIHVPTVAHGSRKRSAPAAFPQGAVFSGLCPDTPSHLLSRSFACTSPFVRLPPCFARSVVCQSRGLVLQTRLV